MPENNVMVWEIKIDILAAAEKTTMEPSDITNTFYNKVAKIGTKERQKECI